MPFSFRFSLNKDRSELPARSDVLHHRFIDRFFELKQVSENLVRQLRRKFAEHFITLHGGEKTGVQELQELQEFKNSGVLEYGLPGRRWATILQLLNSCNC